MDAQPPSGVNRYFDIVQFDVPSNKLQDVKLTLLVPFKSTPGFHAVPVIANVLYNVKPFPIRPWYSVTGNVFYTIPPPH